LAAGLRQDPLGELKPSPRHPSHNKGPTSKGRGRGEGKWGREGGEGSGGEEKEGRKGEERGGYANGPPN